MGAYMKKRDVVNFLTDIDEDYYSPLISSVNKIKGDNVEILVLEGMFAKHLKFDGINAMSRLESEVTTYYDSEYFTTEEDFGPMIDTHASEEEDEWFEGDNVEF